MLANPRRLVVAATPLAGQLLGVVLAGLAGLGAAAATSWSLWAPLSPAVSIVGSASVPVAVVRPTPQPASLPIVAYVPIARRVLPEPAPTADEPVPAVPVIAPVVDETVPPPAKDAWRALTPELDAAWGADTPRTVRLLDDFLKRFPDHALAKEKMYAALIANGRDLVQAGQAAAGAAQLARARQLLPNRLEVVLELVDLSIP